MIPPLQTKSVLSGPPGALLDNASLTVSAVDTAGWKYARARLIVGATDIDVAAWKVQECDTSGGSYADITGAVASGTTGDGRLPTATDDNKIFDILIDLRGRKRYLKPVVTFNDGSVGGYAACIFELYMGEAGPSSSTDQGLGGRIIV